MPFQVVDADRRLVQRIGERAGDAGADQQRAGKPRTARVGDAVQVARRDACRGERLLGQRHHAAHVVARRQFRHDAAIGLVHRDLRMQRLREQTAFRVVHGHAGFVAGGLDAEDAHGGKAEGKVKSYRGLQVSPDRI